MGDYGGGIDQTLPRGDKRFIARRVDGNRRRVEDARVIGALLIVQPLGRVGGGRQLMLGQVAQAIVVAVGHRRVRGHTQRKGCGRVDGHLPAGDLGAILEAVVVAVGNAWIGADLRFLPITQAVIIGVSLNGGIGLTGGTAFKFIGVAQPVAVAVPGAVVGVQPAKTIGEQPVAVTVAQTGEGGVPTQPAPVVALGGQRHKAAHAGREDVIVERVDWRRSFALEGADIADRNDNIVEGEEWDAPTFIGRHGITHVEIEGRRSVEPRLQIEFGHKRRVGDCIAAIHGGQHIFVVNAHIPPVAAHIAP